MSFLLFAVVAFVFWTIKRISDLEWKTDKLQLQLSSLRRSLTQEVRPSPDQPAAPSASSEQDDLNAPEVQLADPFEALSTTKSTVVGPADGGWQRPSSSTAKDTAPATTAPDLASTPSSSSSTGWEQLLGVRGAAIGAGAILVLAGILLFHYAVEHVNFPPTMRIGSALIAGIACLAIGRFLPRTYRLAADSLSGAGLTTLYATGWASHALYHLASIWIIFTYLIGVTVLGGLLALRRQSNVIAILWLVGGFLTPLVIQGSALGDVSLFVYLVLFNLAVMAVARHLNPILVVIALTFTTVYEVFWVAMTEQLGGREPLLLTLGLLSGIFALVAPTRAQQRWPMLPYAALIAPMIPTAILLRRFTQGVAFFPASLLLALLVAMSCWLTRKLPPLRTQQAFVWKLSVPTALATGVVAAFWMQQDFITTSQAWEASVTVVIIAAIFLGFSVWEQKSPSCAGIDAYNAAAISAATGFFALVWAYIVERVDFLAPLLGWVGCALIWVAASVLSRRSSWQPAAALALAIAVDLSLLFERLVTPSNQAIAGISLVLSLVWSGVGRLLPQGDLRSWGERATAILSLGLLVPNIFVSGGDMETMATMVVVVGLVGLLSLRASLAAPRGDLTWGAVVLTSFGHWSLLREYSATSIEAWSLLAVIFVVSQAFVALPLLYLRTSQEDLRAWRASAMAPLAWLAILLVLFDQALSGIPRALVPLSLTLAPSLVGWRFVNSLQVDHPLPRTAAAWLSLAVLSLVAVTLPVQSGWDWMALAASIEGFVLLLLYERLSRAVLHRTATALFAVAFWLLAGPPWLTPSLSFACQIALYWGAAGCMLASAYRLQSWNASTEECNANLTKAGLFFGGAGLTIIFVWINIAVTNVFVAGPGVSVFVAHSQACNFSRTIAWAIYAIVLLALGVYRGVMPLRWASLILLLLTVGKLFLADLSELEDLWRVASLVGMAVSLLLVSVIYQRFVFRRPT